MAPITRKDISDFRTDLSKGNTSERYANKVRNLLLEGAWEVKQDSRAADTGRIFIEFANKRGEPSGIMLSQADKYSIHIGATIGDDGEAYGGFLVIFDTDKVRRYVVEQIESHSDNIRSFPNYGVLIDFADFGKLA